MRVWATVLAVTLCTSTLVRAEEGTGVSRGRGPLTAVGLGFLVVGFGGVGLGIGAALASDYDNQLLAAYVKRGAPTAEEAPTVALLLDRVEGEKSAATVGFILGGAGLAVGLALLVVDGVLANSPPVAVGFSPMAGGGLFVLSARF